MTPMFIIPIPFVFVLLLLLLKKAPNVGVWVVAGLISVVVFMLAILLPIGMHDGLAPTVLPDGREVPFFVVPLPFLFVLLIRLLNKSPKVGATVIVGVVVMGLFGAVLWLGASHRRVAYEQRIEGPGGSIAITQRTLPDQRGQMPPAWEKGYDHLQSPQPRAVPTLPNLQGLAATSPIWSEGVENEYEADVYPSKLAAVRALGRGCADPFRKRSLASMAPPRSSSSRKRTSGR